MEIPKCFFAVTQLLYVIEELKMSTLVFTVMQRLKFNFCEVCVLEFNPYVA